MDFCLSTILVFIAFSSSVFGISDEIRNSFIKTYKNQKQALALYNKFRFGNELSPCDYFKSQVTEINLAGIDNVYIINEIITGDFGGDNGYRLILDHNTTIEIPFIFRCTPKFKIDNDDLRYGGKVYIYYMVVHGNEDGPEFEKVSPTGKAEDKVEFILEEAEITYYLTQNYLNSNHHKRKIIKWWYKEHEKPAEAKQLCVSLTDFGRVSETFPGEWEILNGTIDTNRTFIMYLSETLKINLYGIIVCEVNVTKSFERKSAIEKKYFTLAKTEVPGDSDFFSYLHGPVIIGKQLTFALKPDLLPMIEKLAAVQNKTTIQSKMSRKKGTKPKKN